MNSVLFNYLVLVIVKRVDSILQLCYADRQTYLIPNMFYESADFYYLLHYLHIFDCLFGCCNSAVAFSLGGRKIKDMQIVEQPLCITAFDLMPSNHNYFCSVFFASK